MNFFIRCGGGALFASHFCPPQKSVKIMSLSEIGEPLREIYENVFIKTGSIVFMGVKMAARMTILRLESGLLIYSPIKLSNETREEIDAIGKVKYILAPCLLHHVFVALYCEAFPSATLVLAPNLAIRRPDLAPHGVDHTALEDEEEIDVFVSSNGTAFREILLVHKATHTLLCADYLENFQRDWAHYGEGNAWLNAVIGVFLDQARGPICSPEHSMFTVDVDAFDSFRQLILSQPIERCVMAHGDLIDSNALDVLQEATQLVVDKCRARWRVTNVLIKVFADYQCSTNAVP